MSKPTRKMIKTTCPRDCYDACGIVAAVDDGHVRKILGDPDHHIAKGVLCGKCAIAYNGVWRQPNNRLTRPLKRTGKKGEGAFEPISWDKALGTIASRLKEIIDGGRHDTIVHAHYTGTVGLIAGWYPLRFFSHIGATEVDPDTVCNKAGHLALDYTVGDSLDGFDPETLKDAATILVWGANPSHSAPHMHKAWLRDATAKVIVIDPIVTGTAQDIAETHLQLRPGTDAALAFGLLHVAKTHQLLDREFIENTVKGFEEIEADVDAADPETTAGKTGLTPEQVIETGIAFAKGPSMIWLGQGMQRTARGGNAFRSILALVAGTGQIGKPGTGYCYMNGPGTRGIDMDSATAAHVAQGTSSVSHMDLAATLEDGDRSAALFTWNCNPLASSPDQGRLRKTLEREDLFTVTCDVFPTDTVAYADIVLPAANFLEFDDIVAPYFHHTLSAQVKIQDPPGDALPNQEIFRRLASKMGLEEPLLHESDDELLSRILAMTPYRGGFAELAKAGTVQVFDKPRMQFPDGFPTPSGKIEIASETAEADGLPRVPEPHADEQTAPGRLRILSPASKWQMNSSYANDRGVQRQIGKILVLVHPHDATARGLKTGDKVTLANDVGSLPVTVDVSELTQPGMGVVYKGRWPNAEPSASNINVLHKGEKSDIGEATCVHSMEVDLVVQEAAE
ncbi:MAG: molybdopterin-dependent oxidoreductase [Roseibium sp.]|nr:molybdopterin-dependent oxidoreductase [Roseibium sp.]